MKKLFILAALILTAATITPATAQDYTRKGKTFQQVKKSNTTKSEPKLTTYTYTDVNGNTYPIYQSPSGACFVLRVSKKTGKEYRYYLSTEISAEIARETGVKYEPRKATKK